MVDVEAVHLWVSETCSSIQEQTAVSASAVCACCWLVMRASGVAFAFLALRSRLAERFTRSYVRGALQATAATDLSDKDSRRILILDPASSCCFEVRRPHKSSEVCSFACNRQSRYCSMIL